MATFNNRGHNIELTYQLKQLIKDHTRVTIDLIYTNVSHYHSKSGVIPLCMSDHYMTFTILDLKIPKSNCKSTIVRCRNYNKFDEYLFQQDILNSFVFNTIYNIVDLNEACGAWHAEFLRICEKHAPKRSFKAKQRYNPWFSEHVTKSVYHRDFLHEKAVVSKSPTSMNAYKLARNKVNLAIRKTKKDYYHNIITTNTRDMRSLLKTILPSKINTSRIPTNLTPDIFFMKKQLSVNPLPL